MIPAEKLPTPPVYTEMTRGIKVSVLPLPRLEESDPQGSVFAFSYTITIENTGTETVQLLERHWLVLSADEQIAEVIGPGVVGVQPTLHGGEKFRYTSGAVIHDPVGSMHGSYTFRNNAGEKFVVQIPRFELQYSAMVH
jgi:ApaG protein